MNRYFMNRVLKTLTFLLLCQASVLAYAIDYQYQEVKDFDVFASFKSVEKFEANYEKYVQDCLDNTGGGTGGIPCFIGYDMWDRELNIYYKKLYSQLDKKGKKLLKNSQKAWLTERDLSQKFISMLLDKKYTESGTMYLLMRAGDADSMITPIVKHRALTLRKWIELSK